MSNHRLKNRIMDNHEMSEEIWEDNRKRLFLLSGIVAAAMAIMLVCSFFVDSLEKNRLIYIVLCVLCCYICFTSARYKNRYMTIGTMYLFIFALFVFGILLGTVIEPNETSVSFPILLFALPLCFTEKSWRMNTAVLGGMIVYCIAAVATQDSLMFQYNLTNVIPYGIFSMFICSLMMKIKFNRYELQHRLEQSLEEQRNQINEIAELNRQLEETKTIAEAANNAKTSFLFNMSHDIRTPMNAIMGFRDLLEKHQEEPDKRADYLKKIEDSSNVLLSIINNVLEMARIEKGTVEIDETAWSTEQFDSTIFSLFEEMMKEKSIEFTRRVETEHQYVYCDPTKVREIFFNLLSNAYKYTASGGKVDVYLKELPSDKAGYAVFQTTVTDTGAGMSEEFLPHLFEEFSRESSSTENKIEGTGLGMPIVKRLLEIMGGTIEVQSKKGVGSTFTVTIPHRIAEKSNLFEHADAEINPELFEGKRILLAEDNDLNAEIASEILGEAGFIVDRAEDGAVCCERLTKAPENYYDLILMDIQMPNMNGYEATRTIRSLDNKAKAAVPILAMTANAFEEDKREAHRAGMNGHLAKPIDVTELMKALSGIFG